MSTIRTRSRWIRIELVFAALLMVVLIFPSSPRTVKIFVADSPLYGKVRAKIELKSLQREIEGGRHEAKLRLASLYASEWSYHKYIEGDPEELLGSMVQSGDVSAMFALAFSLRESDPERSSQLLLQAADMGDERAQVFSMRALGLNPNDTETFMQRLYQLQLDRPGWKNSFEKYLALLEQQSAQGNQVASQILERLPVTINEDDS